MFGFWWVLVFASILWLMIGATVLYLLRATLAGVIIFLVLSIVLIVAAIVLRIIIKAKTRKQSPEKSIFSVSKDEEKLFEEAKSYLWEQDGVVVASVFTRGISMIRTEEGQTIPVYGLHFRDRDTDKKYMYGSLVEVSSVRKYQSTGKMLNQQEINDFLSTLAKGVREVIKRRITRTDEYGRPLLTEEVSEPMVTETKSIPAKEESNI